MLVMVARSGTDLSLIHICAQQDRRAARVQPQDRPEFLQQLVDIIAVALLAKAAEAVEILTDLRGRQSHAFRQGAGRDALHAVRLQLTNIAVVAGQALDLSLIHI